MEIKANLFDLTDSDIKDSKMIYSGKIIKCLVAPYHTYDILKDIVPYTKNTFLFPEREVPANHLRNIVSAIVKNKSNDEFLIITANQSIIIDMVDTSVRILTEDGKIVRCPVKTFMANIHDIRYSVLENEEHKISKEKKNESEKFVSNIIKRLNNKKDFTEEEYVEIKKQIDTIGDSFLKHSIENVYETRNPQKIQSTS